MSRGPRWYEVRLAFVDGRRVLVQSQGNTRASALDRAWAKWKRDHPDDRPIGGAVVRPLHREEVLAA